MKSILGIAMALILAAAGCVPLVVGGAGAGAYKVGTDDRTVGRIVDDSNITSRINYEMVNDPDVKARQIDVDTLDGVVTLSGVVETDQEAKRAVEISQSIQGVRSVKNNLQIGTRSMGQTLDDKSIGVKVKSSLVSEPNIKSLNIDVDVYNGVVTLTGSVASPAQKTRVLDLARGTTGVVKVVDNLTVANP